MSKKIKILMAMGVCIFFGVSSFILLKPKEDNGLVEKEISIKQAEVPVIESFKYKDVAGFSFEYPSLLEVREVEVDDNSIFSSLELSNVAGEKLIVKVKDSQFNDTAEWQKFFEEKNVISDVNKVLLVDIPTVKFMFGAPILLKTVGVENKILYTIENVADNGGFWDQAHSQILETFDFDEAIYDESVEGPNNLDQGEGIVLIEEILE